MLELQRRLLSGGNRIYWRDVDLPRIAERFGVSAKELERAPADTSLFSAGIGSEGLYSSETIKQLAQKLLRFASPSSDVNDDEDNEKAEFRFTLSSESVDTYGDVIRQQGWDYRRFDKNPVALQFHRGSTLPIGMWSKRSLESGNLKASLRFSSDRDAKRIEQAVRERTLRMSSVGFMPGEWKWSEDPKRKYGIDFLDGHVLLEASVVSIGANPDALLDADAPGLTNNQNGSEETKPAGQPAKSFHLAQRRMTAIRARF